MVQELGAPLSTVWEVREAVPEQRLVYGWRYEGLPGRATVHWELAGTEAGSRLTFTQEIHEPFPADDPAFTREAGEAGWDHFIRHTLKDYVETGRAANS